MIKINVSKKLLMAHGPATLQIDTVIEGEGITALYGHSGAGKTSLLKIIAGLMQPEKGLIEVNGEVWLNTERKINRPVQQRNIGFVFQDAALFPNMTVEQNLLYAAGNNQHDKTAIARLLQLVNMESLVHSRPAQLSGGQQQRVALVRALIRQPRVLLMDEPLSALDAGMRSQLRTAIQTMQQQFRPATLLVTHDITELHQLAGHVIHIDQGKIVNSGKPAAVLPALSNNLQLTGTIVQIVPSGSQYEVTIQTGSECLVITATPAQISNLQPGDKIALHGQVVAPAIVKRES